MMERKQLPDALRINRIRCILAIVVCGIICVLVFVGVMEQVVGEPNEQISEVGWKSYRMFTILSNMLMAIAASMCIPFAVDGMRYRNYHLPRWYVDFMYVGTTSVAVTFLTALLVLSPVRGLKRIMLDDNNIMLHLICPVLSILLFFFINSDHRISIKDSLIATLPVAIYGILYLILVFIIGEEGGGWRDHYQMYRALEYIPIPVMLIISILIGFAIATLLRLVHNAIHKWMKDNTEKNYQQSEAFSFPDIETAIKALADIDRAHDKGGELTVPRRIMTMMEKKYHSGLSVEEMCLKYIEAYYCDDQGGSAQS